MKNLNWNLFRKVAGAGLLVLGILALFTPLTPGSWLIFVGAEMLGIGILSRENFFKQQGRLRDWWRGRKEGSGTSQEGKENI